MCVRPHVKSTRLAHAPKQTDSQELLSPSSVRHPPSRAEERPLEVNFDVRVLELPHGVDAVRVDVAWILTGRARLDADRQYRRRVAFARCGERRHLLLTPHGKHRGACRRPPVGVRRWFGLGGAEAALDTLSAVPLLSNLCFCITIF